MPHLQTNVSANIMEEGNAYQNVQQGCSFNADDSSFHQIGNNVTAYVTYLTPPNKKSRPDYQKEVVRLQDTIRAYNKQLSLPKVAWLDEGQSWDLENFYMSLQLDQNEIPAYIEDIFKNPPLQSRPNRILVEAPPGYGKTTLSIKLVYDWANNEPYVNHFKLAFRAVLGNLPAGGINQCLALISRMDENIIEKAIQSIEENVLFVLDGFDELSQAKKDMIIPLLFRTLYTKATVVITARTGECVIRPADLEKVYGEAVVHRQFYDVKYNILGLTDVKPFLISLKKVIGTNLDVDHVQNIIEFDPVLFKCPLFVILLAFICYFSGGGTEINTVSKLYKSLFNSILKRSLSKSKEAIDEIDLFQIPKTSPVKNSNFQNKFHFFGELALHHINNDKYKFDESSPLTEEFHILGFLSKHTEVGFGETKVHYEVFHRTILEFAAAYFFWYKFCTNNFHLDDEIYKMFRQLYAKCLYLPSKELPPVLLFFCNLCDTKKLVQQLTPYAHFYGVSAVFNLAEYSWDSEKVFTISRFFEDRNENWESFQEFMPIASYATASPQEIAYAADCKKLQVIYSRLRELDLLPYGITVPQLFVFVLGNYSPDRSKDLAKARVQCQKLVLSLDRISEENCLDLMEKIQRVIDYQRLEIVLHEVETIGMVYKSFPSDLKIDKLTCYDCKNFELLQEFVMRHEVRQLQFKSQNCLRVIPLLLNNGQFMSVITQVENDIYGCDFGQMSQNDVEKTLSGDCKNGESDYLGFTTDVIVEERSRMIETCILSCNFINVLEVTSGNLEFIVEKLHSVDRSIKVNNLILTFDSLCSLTFWNQLAMHVHVKTLKVSLRNAISYSLFDTASGFMQRCGIEHFTVKCDEFYEDDFSRLNLFFGEMTTLLGKKEVQLKSIAIELELRKLEDSVCDVVSILLKILKKKKLKSVEFICNHDIWTQIIDKGLMDHSCYRVNKAMVDEENSSRLLKYDSFDDWEKICFSKYTVTSVSNGFPSTVLLFISSCLRQSAIIKMLVFSPVLLFLFYKYKFFVPIIKKRI